MKVANEAISEVVSAPTRLSRSANQIGSLKKWQHTTRRKQSLPKMTPKANLNIFPEKLLLRVAIKEAVVIQELAQQLNRWLCAIDFNLRHVDIVDEDDISLVCWSAEDVALLAFHLGLDLILNGLRASLSRKLKFNQYNGS